jgi:hypothetical protein
MLKYIIVFLSLGGLVQTCFSQDQEEQIELQFVSFPKSANGAKVELLIGKDKTLPVELPTNSLSPVYKVKSLSQIALGKSSIGPEEEFVFKTYGKAAALNSQKQLILVLRKGAKDSDGYDLVVMNNNLTKFGGGMYYFVNAAIVDIGVEIGDMKLALKPRKRKLVKPKPSKVKGKRKYLYTYLHYREGDKAIPFYESTWRYSDKARCMVFFYHDPNTKQLRTHTIRDYLR